MNRRRLVVWLVVFVLVTAGALLLAPVLASKDPIAEVLLGHGGSTLPLAGLTLVLRLLAIVVVPPFLAIALVRVCFEELARLRASRMRSRK